ncbi:hypothetical protein [Acinetobacter bereziniae]|uniref:hypothetical protein n=1 Tax=Acinetobacter bereziniae TaxID=106648 RepID=UPI001D192791|nr:hypothetical protein [Acinetobacter bereziniae]
MFLQQNPNEGRSKAIFQLDDSKWKKLRATMAQNNDAGKGLPYLKWSWKKRKRITNQRLDKFGVDYVYYLSKFF